MQPFQMKCLITNKINAAAFPFEITSNDENGDVSNTIEVWTIEGGKVTSTGRFESP